MSAFCFTTDGVKENHVIFCPYCGKKITEAKAAEAREVLTAYENPTKSKEIG